MDNRHHDVVLVLVPNVPEGDWRQPLLEVMSRHSCDELHLLHIDSRTESFQWPLLLEFRFPDGSAESAPGRAAELRSDLVRTCPWATVGEATFLSLRQTAAGRESDGADVIVSLYSWQPANTAAERAAVMWEHFAMEQQEFAYTSVHFNVADPSTGNAFDFVFEAYVDDPAAVKQIYASPRLEVMREHSRGFLDTSTRRLAFGRVEIVHRQES